MKNDVKHRILLESRNLFFNHGIKIMTMDELANRIGVSKRTIYENFEDKDALLAAILKYQKKENQKQFEQLLAESPTIIDLMFKYLKCGDNLMFTKMLERFDEIKRYHPKVYASLVKSDYHKEDIGNMKNILEIGVKQGVFRLSIDVDITSSLFQKIQHELILDKDGLRREFEFSALFYTYYNIFLRGICTSKGLKILEDNISNLQK